MKDEEPDDIIIVQRVLQGDADSKAERCFICRLEREILRYIRHLETKSISGSSCLLIGDVQLSASRLCICEYVSGACCKSFISATRIWLLLVKYDGGETGIDYEA